MAKYTKADLCSATGWFLGIAGHSAVKIPRFMESPALDINIVR